MNTHPDKAQENKSQAVANSVAQKQGRSESAFQFVDNRPEAVSQRKLQEMVNSPQVSQLGSVQDMANNSPLAKQAAQLQAKANNNNAKHQPIQKKENNTGLPANLESGIESLSGYSKDDVKVHRNSDKPAQIQAHAYAQGTDIHLGPGQEKHLPHEAWHVVQKKQGLVKSTMQMKGKVNVNDDAELENEAGVMGAKAVRLVGNQPEAVAHQKPQEMVNNSPQAPPLRGFQVRANRATLFPVQRAGGDPSFSFGGSTIEKTTIDNQGAMNKEVEELIEERYGGHHNLFMQGLFGGPNSWRDNIYLYMQETYNLEELDGTNVLTAVRAAKDKFREESLLRLTKFHGIFDPTNPLGRPYTIPTLRDRLAAKGAFLEHEDEDVLEAILNTVGEFAKEKVDVAAGDLEISDADNIVVIMDAHQNKHHNPQLPEFAVYDGGSGSSFAANKNLAWHVANTAPVVRATIAASIADGSVTTGEEPYSPAKDAIDGIIYDLTIVYDPPTGKYVGSYHCNPVQDEQ